MFKPVSATVDFPALERELLQYWYQNGIVEKYLNRNKDSDKKFSFLDGPITANNPMGVHHAWGRTYKDLWQRWYNMRGSRQRFQNGFDEQGLWVEVEVEKELSLKSKKDIENLVPGDKFASLEKFINLCKERVNKFSAIQTDQSKRLGYFMDWDNSYHTSSDENNYWIWHYLKVIHQKGWLYKGRDSVPWCPRCGTAISEHEIESQGYITTIHGSVYIKYPVVGRTKEYLLVWTTTPWTLPGNVAVAVDPNKEYAVTTGEVAGNKYYTSREAATKLHLKIVKIIKGKELVGLKYQSPFDELERVKKTLGSDQHQVVQTDPAILPISEEEGTGLVHIAPGAGTEDFKLGHKLKLPVIELIDEEANYLDGLGEFSYQNAKNEPEVIFNFLRVFEQGEYLFSITPYQHQYPTCWRCKSELVWRVVDEWYIAMDKPSNSKQHTRFANKAQNSKGSTYREQMIKVAKKINWIPKWGLDRELDWLKNMHDWLISKKRYWGLALPIWECQKCNNFEVIGGKDELKEKAVEGWDKFEDHSPHRPWIDRVKVKCSKCGESVARIPDVGNPWLDAGIVPFSTTTEEWFPADFVTEGFPGQFKNWFYSLIAMSTALKNTNPFKNLLGFANVLDEQGEEMHKSKGNAIEFNEAADQVGVDVMRWMYLTQNPELNLNFGYGPAADIKRRFYLILWNIYKFFIDYASSCNWKSEAEKNVTVLLDKWLLARLTELILEVNQSLEKYDAASASRAIEDYVINDLSTWYVRRSRDRVSHHANSKERDVALSVLYDNLITLAKLLAPFTPFIAEQIYRSLTGDESVHLTDYPEGNQNLLNDQLVVNMKLVREVVEKGHAKRKEAGIKLRQPLSKVTYHLAIQLDKELEKIIAEELNVKAVEYKKSSDGEVRVELDTKITPQLQAEGKARELVRQIQQLRKEQRLTLNDQIKVEAPNWPEQFGQTIMTSTATVQLVKGSQLKVIKVGSKSE